MGLWLRLTPRSSRKTRMLLAGLVWSGVGAGLLVAGVHWSLTAPHWRAALLLVVAAVGGWAKGRFLLRRRAEENAARILASADGRCAGGVFSWQAWSFVLLMMVVGALLRRSPLPRLMLGFVYTAVGVALLSASAVSWKHWSKLRREPTTRMTAI